MKAVTYSVACLAVILGSSQTLRAVEQYEDFLAGLRSRGYLDTAIEYLDQIEQRPNVPAEVQQVIPYERAVTLLAMSRNAKTPETQNKQLDEAAAQLEQFVENAPDHPRAADANMERGKIHLGRARIAVYQSKSPANKGNRLQFQQKGRDLVTKARQIFQEAHDKYEALWESFGTFIPAEEKEKRKQRAEAEKRYIRAQMDLAECTYVESQTYDEDSPEYKELLIKAADEFRVIHEKYRSQVAGLYARMWQGKCFEEQDDLGKALGIYKELLAHPGTSGTMNRIKDQALQFRLICLNHDQRQDHQLVIQEASEWLQDKRGAAARTRTANAIRFERAKAYELLAEKMLETRISPDDEGAANKMQNDRNELLRLALRDAQEVNKSPGEFKDVSQFMITRIQALLGEEGSEPKDFETAFGLARSMLKKVKAKQDAVAEENDKGKRAALQGALDTHLRDTADMFRKALALANDETDPMMVHRARYLLAYVLYLMRDSSYESAILASYVARAVQDDDPSMASDAAYMAMAAYVQAYNAVPKGQSKDVEMKMLTRVCSFIDKKWPDSDRANDARNTLGRIYSRLDRPQEAAEWYGKIPPTANLYAQGQLNAGQAYWNAYLKSAVQPDDERPSDEQLQEWTDAAQQHLETGIDETEQKIPSDSPASEELIAAKVSLAQILNSKSQYTSVISLLTGIDPDNPEEKIPHPVIPAIQAKEGEQRPSKGIKSVRFASLAYQMLLRAYVGEQKIDDALATMDDLERVVSGQEGSDDTDAIMAVYVELGKEIQNEVERVKSDPERLSEVLTSFDQFLAELLKRTERMTFNSLIWISTTYYGLGEGVDETAKADNYFDNAAQTFQTILDKAAQDSEFAPPDRLPGIKLRLANCRRRQGEYETALELAKEVLSKNVNILDGQIEAASILQDWGTDDPAGSAEKLLTAINGQDIEKGDHAIWGWGHLANRLYALVMAGKAKENPTYRTRLFEARYNISDCRQLYGMSQSGAKKIKALRTALAEIEAFAAITTEVTKEWIEKFNGLYRTVFNNLPPAEQTKIIQEINERQELAKKPPIATIDDYIAKEIWAKNPAPPEAAPVVKKTGDGGEKPENGNVQTQPPDTNWGMVFAGLFFAVGGAGGIAFWMKKSQGKDHAPKLHDTGPAPIPGAAPQRRSKKKRKVATKASSGSPGKTKGSRPAGAKASASSGKKSSEGKSASSGKSAPSGQKSSSKPGKPKRSKPQE